MDNTGVVSLKGYHFYVPGDLKCRRYPVQLCETDMTGPLPEVYKVLIEKVFLQNAKPSFREMYYEPGTVLDNVKQKVFWI